MEGNTYTFYCHKIILLGDSGVGKSNLVRRFITNDNPKNIQPTIGAEYHTKEVDIGASVRLKAQIWDTAGQERYKSIVSAHYRKARGALLVYDITNRKSFESLRKWIDELKFHAGDDVKILLAGNKSDLSNQRAVTEAEGKKLAGEYKILFLETSAFDGKSVTDAFEELLKTVHEAFKNVSDNDEPTKKLDTPNAESDKGGCNC